MIYRIKTLTLLRDIWHRGAMLIIKKFKFLKRRGQKDGKWSFGGFKEKEKEGNKSSPDIQYSDDPILIYLRETQKVCKREQNREGFEFSSMLEELYNDAQLDELVDIRENSAYIAFVQLIGGYINYEEDGYEILSKEYKRELKYAGGNLLEIQLREIINRSIDEFIKFFESFPSFEAFEERLEEDANLKQTILHKNPFQPKTEVIDNSITKEDVYQSLPFKRHMTSVENIEFTRSGMIMSK